VIFFKQSISVTSTQVATAADLYTTSSVQRCLLMGGSRWFPTHVVISSHKYATADLRLGVLGTLCILIDTGRTSSIIYFFKINKSLLVKNSRSTTEWTTLGGKFYTKTQGTVNIKLPEFF
jgi:hypothetical protein